MSAQYLSKPPSRDPFGAKDHFRVEFCQWFDPRTRTHCGAATKGRTYCPDCLPKTMTPAPCWPMAGRGAGPA